MYTKEASIPKFPQRLPGSFWGITVYFNPCRYKNKLLNYRRFREASRRQGLRLICVELAFKDLPFELTNTDADILVQRRSGSIMWQKERLLNIGLGSLPPDCDKVAWIDADILFKNNDWIKETSRLLEEYKVVQPYGYVLKLANRHIGRQCAEKLLSKACAMAQPHTRKLIDRGLYCHPGLAWAGRRDWLEHVGLYDRMILGGADYVMADAFYQRENIVAYMAFQQEFAKDMRRWREMVYAGVQGSVSFTSGTILHLWHGEDDYRLKNRRLHILCKYRFKPGDICLNADGCWEWATPKKELHSWVQEYFQWRREEGSFTDSGPAKMKNLQNFQRIILLERLDSALGRIASFLGRYWPALYFFLKRLWRKRPLYTKY